MTTQQQTVQLQVGKPAPDFNMLTTKNMETLNERVTLADYKGKWLILFFWPFDFTFVCPTEVTSFSDNMDEFEDLDCEVLGVSTDSVHTPPGSKRRATRTALAKSTSRWQATSQKKPPALTASSTK